MSIITAHCLVKNEENFVGYALRSVVDFVDQIIVFDTGSTDNTVEIIKSIIKEYPNKIIFEEKGECDKKRHTELRQEMVERTKTPWIMILDGDEVWTKRAMEEVLAEINKNTAESLIAPFYLCVGDVRHSFVGEAKFAILGKKGNYTIRFVKNTKGLSWLGEYGKDSIFDSEGNVFFNKENSLFLKNKFWHLTHLRRSSLQFDYSSGKIRENKVIPTYFLLGKTIPETIPEVFQKNSKVSEIYLSFTSSFINFFLWITKKLMRSFGIKAKTVSSKTI